jgi:hypothetical protein
VTGYYNIIIFSGKILRVANLDLKEELGKRTGKKPKKAIEPLMAQQVI